MGAPIFTQLPFNVGDVADDMRAEEIELGRSGGPVPLGVNITTAPTNGRDEPSRLVWFGLGAVATFGALYYLARSGVLKRATRARGRARR